MRYPISKLIWAGLIIALIFLGAMFILPVVGAVLIGVFALSCLIWLSSKSSAFSRAKGLTPRTTPATIMTRRRGRRSFPRSGIRLRRLTLKSSK